MSADWDKQKRVIWPYLQRADEIEKLDPKVAYYCRLYAVDQGINLDNRHKEADELLGVVLTRLEEAKPVIELDQEEDKKHCEHFALNVFRKAQRKDENGVADRDTAKAYYAAFNFLEILKQFGGKTSEEIEKLRRFALFRASEIKKALDDNRQPPPLKPYPAPSNGSDSVAPWPYDPGYQVGLKVLCSEDGRSPGLLGTVTSVATTVEGTFGIEMDDGRQLDVSAQYLAPALPPETQVAYFTPDGIQVDAEVTDMERNIWPPTYGLVAIGGGGRYLCTHDSFTLVHVPIEPSIPQSPWPQRPLMPETVEGALSQIGVTGPSETHSQDLGPFGAPPLPPKIEPPGSMELRVPYVPPQPSPPNVPNNMEVKPDPRLIAAHSATLSEWRPLLRKSGFEPDLQAIEDAKRCAKFANTSLNFSDVDNAVNYLVDAMKLLTGYADFELGIRIPNMRQS